MTETSAFHILSFSQGGEVHEEIRDSLVGYERPADPTTVTWIDAEGIDEASVVDQLDALFSLPPQSVRGDDLYRQRPRVEEFDTHLRFTLQMLRLTDDPYRVIAEHIFLNFGDGFVISLQEGAPGDVFSPVRAKIRQGRGGIMRRQSDYLVYHLIEEILDNTFDVLDTVGEEIDALQDRLLEDPTFSPVHQVRDLRRLVRFVRASIWPLREALGELERSDSALINNETRESLRRAYEHAVQLIDLIELVREMLSDTLNIYLSDSSQRLNEIMKTLTMISTIFLPLTLVAGIYGMNFRYMPELTWRFGYPLIMGLMVVISVAMLVYFHWRDWL